MTVPPLPASPCVRVRLNYTALDSTELGSRFYLSYGGAAPTAGNCATLAADIASAWGTHLASAVSTQYNLAEVDVLDIATDSGLSGQWTGATPGTDSSASLPGSVALNIEFGIARRYRGGKPRMFLPPPGNDALANIAHFTTAFTNAANTQMAAFFAQIEALTIGTMGALTHVNLSYYKGFTNITNSSGRERAVPTYRTAALVEPVTGYFAKTVIGSQRRRRTSTTY